MRTLFLGGIAALFFTSSLAIAAPEGHGRLHGFFTPEQRVMFMLGARDQTQGMTHDQRHAFRHDQIAKVKAMSDAERTKLRADLQAQWDALPQARKDRIEQRIAERQSRHEHMTPNTVPQTR